MQLGLVILGDGDPATVKDESSADAAQLTIRGLPEADEAGLTVLIQKLLSIVDTHRSAASSLLHPLQPLDNLAVHGAHG